MAEQTDPPQPQPPAEGGEGQRSMVDTLAEAQALAALDEMIAKVDSVGEGAAAHGALRAESQEPPPEAYGVSGEAPPFDGWYVAVRDNAQGPLTVDQLTDKWSRGEIGADTLCWREGMIEWRPLSRLHALTTAIVPRPREGLKALSSRPPVKSQPSGFAPSASKMLRSLAEQEVQTERQVGVVPVAAPAATPAPPPAAEARSPTSPTRAEGPKKVHAPPAVKPPMFSAERREDEEEEEEERPKKVAGVSGAKLFVSLFAASVLGGVVGGYVVKVTMPPPLEPEPVVAHEPPAPAPTVVVRPPAPPAKTEEPPPAKIEAPAPQPPPAVQAPKKVEAKPKAAKPPAEEEEAESVTGKPPPGSKKPAPAPPKSQLDTDFEKTFGQ